MNAINRNKPAYYPHPALAPQDARPSMDTIKEIIAPLSLKLKKSAASPHPTTTWLRPCAREIALPALHNRQLQRFYLQVGRALIARHQADPLPGALATSHPLPLVQLQKRLQEWHSRGSSSPLSGARAPYWLKGVTRRTLKLGRKMLRRSGSARPLIPKRIRNLPAAERATLTREIRQTRQIKQLIIQQLARHLAANQSLGRRQAWQQAQECFWQQEKLLLNQSHWKTVVTAIDHHQQHFVSELRPASQMKLPGQHHSLFADSYHDRGICSKSADETTHAVNLWSSRLTVAGPDGQQCLFQGLRHGVNSPYALAPGSAERTAGALRRATEVVAAALYLQPEKLHQALEGQCVNLHLSSISLMTPVSLGSVLQEKQMLDDQLAAWQQISAAPLTLVIRNHEGKLSPVSLNVQVAAFNFGVNELALGRLGLGHQYADRQNERALQTLLGDNLAPSARPGGWAGQVLDGNPPNAERIISLIDAFKRLWQRHDHHHDGGDPYKAGRLMALLCHELGIMPCWNCKSGKDRTGMLDAEIKRQAIELHQGQQHLEPGPLDARGSRLLQKLLLNSGNLTVQRYNTGTAGNKTLKHDRRLTMITGDISVRRRVADREVVRAGKGMSDLV